MHLAPASRRGIIVSEIRQCMPAPFLVDAEPRLQECWQGMQYIPWAYTATNLVVVARQIKGGYRGLRDLEVEKSAVPMCCADVTQLGRQVATSDHRFQRSRP